MTNSEPVNILLVGTLDTKGAEYAYARDIIQSRGLNPVLMDVGVMGRPQCEPDISAGEVARAGGEDILVSKRKGEVAAMPWNSLTRGAVNLAMEYVPSISRRFGARWFWRNRGRYGRHAGTPSGTPKSDGIHSRFR